MKILGYDYIIVQDKSQDDMGAMGRFHSGPQKIQIANDIHDQEVISTLLHEILEALNFHLNLGLGTDNAIVSPLEAGLYQVFTDNGIDLSPLAQYIQPKQ